MYPWSGKTVMIVDDSDMVRACLKHLYQEVGLRVIAEAAHGQEALDKIKENAPDVVSLDVLMPVMSGPEFYKEARDEGLNLNFLIVSCVCALELDQIDSVASFSSEIFISKLPSILNLTEALSKVFELEVKESAVVSAEYAS